MYKPPKDPSPQVLREQVNVTPPMETKKAPVSDLKKWRAIKCQTKNSQ